MTAAQKALLDIYGPYMDFTHTLAFMAGWEAAMQNVAKEAEVFRCEDNGDKDDADALDGIGQAIE